MFEYDFSQRRDLAPLAKNSLRKLRTIRHPDVLKFMDVVESDTTILIMTERVRPLDSVLQAWASKGVQEKEDWILWGLHRISVRLERCAFYPNSYLSSRSPLPLSMILALRHTALFEQKPSFYRFQESGSWVVSKSSVIQRTMLLFSMYAIPVSDALYLIYFQWQSMGSLLPDNMSWAPPEVKKEGWSSIKQ